MRNQLIIFFDNSKVRRFVFFSLLLLVGLFFLYINIKMPLVGEDYTMQPWGYHAAPSSLLEKIRIISLTVYRSSIMWSPRIGEQLSTITSTLPKIYFDLVNTILFIWLLVVLFVLGYGRFPRYDNYYDDLTLFIICFLIFLVFPLLGQVFFWKTGATNHFWGLIILLSFILPFRLNYSRKIEIRHFYSLILYILLGFFAGLTIENAAGVTFIFLLGYYIYSYHNNAIDRKFIYPLLANFIGLSILLFSPGTAFRRNYYSQFGYDGNYKGLALLINRFERVHIDFVKTTWVLLIIFFICLITYIFIIRGRNQTEDRKITVGITDAYALAFLFVMAYLSVLSMITISYQSDQRRGFAFFWLILISQIAYFISNVLILIPKRITLIIVLIFSIILVIQMYKIGAIYTHFNEQNRTRMEIIYSALKTGEKDIVLPDISIPDSRILETREILSDLGSRIAKYYHFDSVEIEK